MDHIIQRLQRSPTDSIMPPMDTPAPLVEAADPAAQFSPWRRNVLAQGGIRSVPVDGHRICLVDRGTGPAVALLHGLGGSAFDWRHLIEPLVQSGRRVIAPDLIGCGYSDKPDVNYSIGAQADRIAKLFDGLGLTNLVVGGNSYGGGVSLILAQRRPDLVRALVLFDPVCYRHPMPGYLKVLTIPYLAEMVMMSIPARRSVKHVLREGFFDPKRVTPDALEEYAHELSLEGTGTALIRMIRDIMPPDPEAYEKAIAQIRKPALIFWGREDRILRPHLAPRLHKDLRGSRLCMLSECGHMPNQERPDLAVPEVLRFLGELDRWTIPEEWNPAVE